jgi:hypothetical protein
MSRAGVPARWEAFVEHFGSGWRNPDLDAFIAHFKPVFADDARLIQPLAPTATGPDALAKVFRRLFAALPDLRGEVIRWGTSDDGVFIELELTANVGRREVKFRACDRVILNEDGVATERRTYMDPAPLTAAFLRTPTVWPRLIRASLSR